MSKSTWNAEANRDLLIAMAMSENSAQKPNPKWEKVEGIMKEWGYGFSGSALYQHFTKRIWKQVVENRGPPGGATPTPASGKKRGGRAKGSGKKVADRADTESDDNADGSDSEIDTPSKKRKTGAGSARKTAARGRKPTATPGNRTTTATTLSKSMFGDEDVSDKMDAEIKEEEEKVKEEEDAGFPFVERHRSETLI